MNYITKSDINQFGSYADRKDHFDDAKLYGSNLTELEKSLFKKHRDCKLK